MSKKLPRDKSKSWYCLEFGKSRGQRLYPKIFIKTHPSNASEKRHNKEALAMEDIEEETILKKAQIKTRIHLQVPLHPVAKKVIGENSGDSNL